MQNEYYYLLLDANNMGVLYPSTNLFLINSLKEGFLEGTVRSIFPLVDPKTSKFDPSTFISEKELPERNVTWHWVGKSQRLRDLPKDHITDDFLNKKRLASLRAPFIKQIQKRTVLALNDKAINMPLSHNIDSALQNALNESDVQHGIYHRDILELARIRNWTPEMAYKDTKLRIESSNSAKVKIYGLTQKFIALANQCHTRDDLDLVIEEYDNITIRNQRI